VQLVNPNRATTAPARARVLEKLKKIKIHEGRNREVRRMFEALGYFVEKLIRVRIGNVELGRLAPGEIRPLMRTEIIKLKRTIRFEDSRSEPEKRKRAGSRR
jgi:16S rRNA U516 pseudouridylate synthase RsuA-like enzyme